MQNLTKLCLFLTIYVLGEEWYSVQACPISPDPLTLSEPSKWPLFRSNRIRRRSPLCETSIHCQFDLEGKPVWSCSRIDTTTNAKCTYTCKSFGTLERHWSNFKEQKRHPVILRETKEAMHRRINVDTGLFEWYCKRSDDTEPDNICTYTGGSYGGLRIHWSKYHVMTADQRRQANDNNRKTMIIAKKDTSIMNYYNWWIQTNPGLLLDVVSVLGSDQQQMLGQLTTINQEKTDSVFDMGTRPYYLSHIVVYLLQDNEKDEGPDLMLKKHPGMTIHTFVDTSVRAQPCYYHTSKATRSSSPVYRLLNSNVLYVAHYKLYVFNSGNTFYENIRPALEMELFYSYIAFHKLTMVETNWSMLNQNLVCKNTVIPILTDQKFEETFTMARTNAPMLPLPQVFGNPTTDETWTKFVVPLDPNYKSRPVNLRFDPNPLQDSISNYNKRWRIDRLQAGRSLLPVVSEIRSPERNLLKKQIPINDQRSVDAQTQHTKPYFLSHMVVYEVPVGTTDEGPDQMVKLGIPMHTFIDTSTYPRPCHFHTRLNSLKSSSVYKLVRSSLLYKVYYKLYTFDKGTYHENILRALKMELFSFMVGQHKRILRPRLSFILNQKPVSKMGIFPTLTETEFYRTFEVARTDKPLVPFPYQPPRQHAGPPNAWREYTAKVREIDIEEVNLDEDDEIDSRRRRSTVSNVWAERQTVLEERRQSMGYENRTYTAGEIRNIAGQRTISTTASPSSTSSKCNSINSYCVLCDCAFDFEE